MNESSARAVIHKTFRDDWALTPPVPYTFENEAFNADGLGEFVRLVVRHSPGGQETLGAAPNRVFTRRGLVMIQLFVAVDRGLLRLDEVGRAARDIFEGKTIGQVRFHDGTYQELPREDRWMRGLVTIVFAYDEQK